MKQIVCEFPIMIWPSRPPTRCASRVILFWKRALKQKNIRRKRLRSAMAGQLMGFPPNQSRTGSSFCILKTKQSPARWVARSVFLVQMSRPAGFAVGC